MPTYHFKTNIKCDGCIGKVKPHLDGTAGIREWSVDLQSPDRVLTVDIDQPDENAVIRAISAAGYQAVKLP
jgi:copper chaperone